MVVGRFLLECQRSKIRPKTQSWSIDQHLSAAISSPPASSRPSPSRGTSRGCWASPTRPAEGRHWRRQGPYRPRTRPVEEAGRSAMLDSVHPPMGDPWPRTPPKTPSRPPEPPTGPAASSSWPRRRCCRNQRRSPLPCAHFPAHSTCHVQKGSTAPSNALHRILTGHNNNHVDIIEGRGHRVALGAGTGGGTASSSGGK